MADDRLVNKEPWGDKSHLDTESLTDELSGDENPYSQDVEIESMAPDDDNVWADFDNVIDLVSREKECSTSGSGQISPPSRTVHFSRYPTPASIPATSCGLAKDSASSTTDSGKPTENQPKPSTSNNGNDPSPRKSRIPKLLKNSDSQSAVENGSKRQPSKRLNRRHRSRLPKMCPYTLDKLLLEDTEPEVPGNREDSQSLEEQAELSGIPPRSDRSEHRHCDKKMFAGGIPNVHPGESPIDLAKYGVTWTSLDDGEMALSPVSYEVTRKDWPSPVPNLELHLGAQNEKDNSGTLSGASPGLIPDTPDANMPDTYTPCTNTPDFQTSQPKQKSHRDKHIRWEEPGVEAEIDPTPPALSPEGVAKSNPPDGLPPIGTRVLPPQLVGVDNRASPVHKSCQVDENTGHEVAVGPQINNDPRGRARASRRSVLKTLLDMIRCSSCKLR